MFKSSVCSLWFAWNCVVCLGSRLLPRMIIRLSFVARSSVGQICSFRLVRFGTRFSCAIPLKSSRHSLCFGSVSSQLVLPPWVTVCLFTASPSGSFFFISCCGSSCCTVFHRSITRRSSCSLSQRNDSFASSLCLIAIRSAIISSHHFAECLSARSLLRVETFIMFFATEQSKM